jgi:hypothetical protein
MRSDSSTKKKMILVKSLPRLRLIRKVFGKPRCQQSRQRPACHWRELEFTKQKQVKDVTTVRSNDVLMVTIKKARMEAYVWYERKYKTVEDANVMT